ncbi:MAG: Ig-like domain-containing protein, partial [Thermoplasmatales archaeon]|nr:Ig-like domain-containing protein [Thermoplasmatales archaeon]
ISATVDGTYVINLTVTDNAGNSAYDTMTLVWDTTPPTVSFTTPANTTTGVAISISIQVTFSEGMNTTSVGSGAVQAVDAFGLFEEGNSTKVAGTITWNAAKGILTFNPTSNLDPDVKYYINITTDAKDKSEPGNNLQNVFSAWFETTSALSITVDIPSTPDIVWTGGTNHDIQYTIAGGTPNYDVTLEYSTNGGGAWNSITTETRGAPGTYTYTWSVTSADSINCYVRASVADNVGSSASDESVNAFEIDSTAPTVSSTTPANAATGVAINTNIDVEFSEGMNHTATEDAFGLYPEGSAEKVDGVPSWVGNTLTFNPASDLNPNTKYYINITTAAADDSDPGNNIAV